MKKNPFGKLRQRLSLFGYSSYAGTIKHSIDHTPPKHIKTHTKREFNQIYGTLKLTILKLYQGLEGHWELLPRANSVQRRCQNSYLSSQAESLSKGFKRFERESCRKIIYVTRCSHHDRYICNNWKIKWKRASLTGDLRLIYPPSRIQWYWFYGWTTEFDLIESRTLMRKDKRKYTKI